MIRLLDSPLLRFQLPYFLTGWKRRLLGGDPLCLTFFVTSVCNGKCIHCLNVGRPPSNAQALTPAEVDRIAASMKPFANLLVSGGEPFLRDDLAELLEPFSRHCRVGQITVPTNASQPDRIETITARLAGACPDTKLNIRIGIDGPPQLHDEIRGIDGGFEAAVETARRVQRLRADHPNLWLEFCFTLSTRNQDAFEDLLAEFDRRGIEQTPYILLCRPPTAIPDLWRVSRSSYVRAHQARERRMLGMSSAGPRQVPPFFERIIMAYIDATRRRILKLWDDPERRWRCSAGALSLVMDEMGTVYPCETLWQPVGNLRELDYDMRGVLDGDELRLFRASIRDGCRCTHETNVTLDSAFTLGTVASALRYGIFPYRSGAGKSESVDSDPNHPACNMEQH